MTEFELTFDVEFTRGEIFAVWKALLLAKERTAARAVELNRRLDSGDEGMPPEEREAMVANMAGDLVAVCGAVLAVGRVADAEGLRLVDT
jgi:hypothetical protein